MAEGLVCRPGSVPGCLAASRSATIHLGPPLPAASCGLPAHSGGQPSNVRCSTLLRAGFAEPTRSPGPLVVSCTTVSPLPRSGDRGGLFSVALSRGLLRVGVAHRPALGSPDLPRHHTGAAAARPTPPRAQCRAAARKFVLPEERQANGGLLRGDGRDALHAAPMGVGSTGGPLATRTGSVMSRGRFLLGGALVAATFSTVAIAPTTAHTGDPAPSARRFARAAWTPDGTVRAITLTKQRVYIAGDFTHLRSVATGKVVRRPRVAAFRRDNGALVRGFQPTANGSVDAMAVLGHKLFLGGDFTAVNRVDRQHLAAVNRRTGGLTSITAEVDGPVWTLLAMQGSVYVGGDFEHVDGLLRTHLFALDASGVLSSTWPDQAAGTTKGGVYTLAATANQRSVIVGGGFTKL